MGFISHTEFEPSTRAVSSPVSVGRLARRLEQRLAQRPRIAVAGEFNSGKSTLINALIGAPVLPTGVRVNTRVAVRIHSGAAAAWSGQPNAGAPTAAADGDAMQEIAHASGRIEGFELIDTPGFQSGDPALCGRAAEACRQAHIAIWCTTAMQAWKATELNVWEAMPRRLRANGILAITFKDMIGSPAEAERLMGRLAREAAPYFRRTVLLSCRDAAAARAEPLAAEADRLWQVSGGADLADAVDEAVSRVFIERLRGAEALLASAARPAPARELLHA